MSDEIVSLREFMDLKFHGIERELANLRSAFERIALEMVTRTQFERMANEVDEMRGRIAGEVDGMSSRIVELEKRIASHDADMRVIRWLGGAVASVTIYLVVAYLRNLLGM